MQAIVNTVFINAFTKAIDISMILIYNYNAMKNNDSISQERRKLAALLEHYEYGKMPTKPAHVTIKIETISKSFAAGKANLVSFSLGCQFEDGESYTLPITAAIPTKGDGHAAFIHIKRDDQMPDAHQPTEELCDGGFAVFTVAENKIFTDGDSHKSGLARRLSGERRALDSPGRAAMLAWCAMRVMDAITCEFPAVDLSRTAVVGHGVFAISALLTGAFDERFAFVISNSSGFGGAASVLFDRGELYERKRQYPSLFCDRYYNLSGREDELPFDQDALLSLIAPRPIFLDNADDLLTNIPLGELMSAYRASHTYKKFGKTGLKLDKSVNPCEVFDANEPYYLPGGDIVYRKREGFPYLSREDWAEYMKFVLTNDR